MYPEKNMMHCLMYKIFHEYSCTHKLLIHYKAYIKLRSRHNGDLSFNECPNSTKIDTVIWINYYLNNQKSKELS